MSLAPRPVRLLQTQGDKTNRGLYMKGDFSLTPEGMPFFARWDSDDRFVQILISSHVLQSVAEETLDTNPDCLELIPKFRTRDPQLESIGITNNPKTELPSYSVTERSSSTIVMPFFQSSYSLRSISSFHTIP
jgi:hypothetical protein